MGWYEAVGAGIYEALCAAFDLDPDGAGLKRFVPAYIEDVVTPQAPRNIDVTYYNVEKFTGNSGLNYQQARQITKNGLTKTQLEKSVPASVLITFYGPNADDDSEKFWSMFLWDGGKGSPRAILRKHGIVPIGKELDRPQPIFEVEGTYQRRRSDLRINLAYLETTEHESSEVTTPPEVVLQINEERKNLSDA